MLQRRRLLATLLTLAGLVACGSLPADAVQPRVSVAGMRIVEVGLVEQRYSLRLRLQNPSDFAFAVTGMDYALELNGRAFATGVSDRRVDLPAYAERYVEVEVSSGLADLVAQLRALENGLSSGLRYRIHGHVRIEGMATRVPFDHSAELLPGGDAEPPPPGGGVILTERSRGASA